MYPIVFRFGDFALYTYGLFVVLGFISAISYMSYSIKRSKEKIISRDKLYSLILFVIFSSMIGARLLYVLVNPDYFFQYPSEIIKIWEGGIVYYGGFICAALFVTAYAAKKKISILKLGDLFAPALALGHCFGRIGCFFAGCCYGKATNVPWSVVFNNPMSVAVRGVHVHPTQLYESFANLLLFLFLHFHVKKEKAGGEAFGIYMTAYGLIRFSIEFFRGDDRGAQYLGFSISQIISLFVFAIGVCISLKVNKNERKDNLRKI
jgi:phosphatidylglycerol:prolipoprotein diacylglycerol transferase